MGVIKATLDEIHLFRNSLSLRVVIESPMSLMPGPYWWGSSVHNSSHIFRENWIYDPLRTLQWTQAFIECCTTCNCIHPKLLNRLILPQKVIQYTSDSDSGQVVVQVREIARPVMTARYIDQLAPECEPEVVTVLMQVYNTVQGVPWFKTQQPEIDWATNWLTAIKPQKTNRRHCDHV